ncbi:hypothetical protein CWI37_1184p0010 [Hamiltosporidium tvaerminnensis]|uniref:Uncharacterized protein n=2 Tax=Hamiltosporidium TaxID=1176354 RepID=A0A4Q9LHE5_9MICR|nr:hypothetical protein CWI37_1184p0010 [Hamiltosporidium tvaerminnensis]TBU07543.1 hypothetical protein CWI36_0260p0040 [Hamiltosporidium magnivora]TBU07761.1 hypothetical protein CWI36_0231p0040 [Hamiltosporidium magnivora]
MIKRITKIIFTILLIVFMIPRTLFKNYILEKYLTNLLLTHFLIESIVKKPRFLHSIFSLIVSFPLTFVIPNSISNIIFKSTKYIYFILLFTETLLFYKLLEKEKYLEKKPKYLIRSLIFLLSFYSLFNINLPDIKKLSLNISLPISINLITMIFYIIKGNLFINKKCVDIFYEGIIVKIFVQYYIFLYLLINLYLSIIQNNTIRYHGKWIPIILRLFIFYFGIDSENFKYFKTCVIFILILTFGNIEKSYERYFNSIFIVFLNILMTIICDICY